MTDESTPQTILWAEQFKAAHPIDKLPPEARGAFTDIVGDRAAIRDYYLAIPEDRFDKGINEGDSPLKELKHQVKSTRIRAMALATGAITTWNYGEIDPEENARLESLSRAELIAELDRSTEALYKACTPENLGRTEITVPYGMPPITPLGNLWLVSKHDAFHNGMLVQFGNYFEIPRPQSTKDIWG